MTRLCAGIGNEELDRHACRLKVLLGFLNVFLGSQVDTAAGVHDPSWYALEHTLHIAACLAQFSKNDTKLNQIEKAVQQLSEGGVDFNSKRYSVEV